MSYSRSYKNTATRILVAAAVQVLLEKWWFSMDHIPGYLFYFNHYRIRDEQIDAKYRQVWSEYYPRRTVVWINILVAFTIWFVNVKLKFLCPKSVRDIAIFSIAYVFLAMFVQYSSRFIMDMHWLTHGQTMVYGQFVLFYTNCILFVKFNLPQTKSN